MRGTPLLTLAVIAAHAAVGAGLKEDTEERLIGWQGDSFTPSKPPWVQTIAWRPRSFLFRNFLTTLEAKHIAEKAWPRMKRSTGAFHG